MTEQILFGPGGASEVTLQSVLDAILAAGVEVASYDLNPFEGAQIVVTGTEVLLAAANENRGLLAITNLGPSPVRIGKTGVTASGGVARLLVNDSLILEAPYIPIAAIYGIVEAGPDSTLLVAESNIGDSGFGTGGGFGL